MSTLRILRLQVLCLLLITFCAAICAGENMGSGFSYQGRLMDSGGQAQGVFDLRFALCEDAVLPGQLAMVSLDDVQVDNGHFSVMLDFGDYGLFDGNERWLEIAVRQAEFSDPCEYTALSPRQKVSPAPYALYALSAGQSDSSISGAGTANYLAKFADTQTVGDSAIYESGGSVGIGTTAPERLLHLVGVNPRVLIEASSSSPEVNLKSSDDSASETWSIYKNSGTDNLEFYQNGTKMTIQSGTGNVGVGTAAGEAKLNVGGSGSSGTGVHVEGSTDGVYATGDTGVSGSGTTHGVWGMGAVEGGHFIATGSNGIGVNALAAVSIAIGIEGGYVGFAEQTVSYLLTGR